MGGRERVLKKHEKDRIEKKKRWLFKKWIFKIQNSFLYFNCRPGGRVTSPYREISSTFHATRENDFQNKKWIWQVKNSAWFDSSSCFSLCHSWVLFMIKYVRVCGDMKIFTPCQSTKLTRSPDRKKRETSNGGARLVRKCFPRSATSGGPRWSRSWTPRRSLQSFSATMSRSEPFCFMLILKSTGITLSCPKRETMVSSHPSPFIWSGTASGAITASATAIEPYPTLSPRVTIALCRMTTRTTVSCAESSRS